MSVVTTAPNRPAAPPPVARHLVAPARRRSPAVWLLRIPLVLPFVFMAPLVLAALAGRPGAIENISTATADVLGTSSCIAFFVMLAITPIHTVTGWRWHLVLRRDYGIAMFAIALTDLILAAVATGDTFPGGLPSRIAGRALLVAGTAAVLLSVPLVVTANRRAQRWLGPHWRRLHRLTYVVWALIVVHLLLLFGLRSFFVDAVLMSVPLVVLRAPPVRRWWVTMRRTSRRRVVRVVGSVALLVVYGVGFVPFIRELATVGLAAFGGHPIHD